MERKTNFFDKLGSLIPGYEGYLEREGRRKTDKILRSSIDDKLRRVENEIENKKSDCIESNDLENMRKWEKLRKKVNTLRGKILYASYGETGFFNDVEIKEDELQKIYEIDKVIFDSTQNLASGKSSDLQTTQDKIEEIEGKVEEREDYLNSF